MNVPFHLISLYKTYTYVDNCMRMRDYYCDVSSRYDSLLSSYKYYSSLLSFVREFTPEFIMYVNAVDSLRSELEACERAISRSKYYAGLCANITPEQFSSWSYMSSKVCNLPHFVRYATSRIRCNQKKTANIRRRIESMFWDCDVDNGESVYFITFTFSDNSFSSLSKETRHRYIARFCKASSVEYIANIDYGGHFAREHYHACMVLSEDKARALKKNYNLGFIDIRPVRSESDSLRVSKYINKLVNHAVKVTADRIIFSRILKMSSKKA